MKVCVLGLGYIGLPTAAILADVGKYKVLGVDINPEIINKVNQGAIHIVESGLENIVSKVVKAGSLRASLKPEKSDVFIIAVPTPLEGNETNIPEPNIKYVLSAATAIADVICEGDLVIVESTSPLGTTQQVADLIFSLTKFERTSIDFAYCPERVLPGKILEELISNDRVIGGLSEQASLRGKQFYSTFCKGELLTTNTVTAEMVKLTENAYRDLNIAFANEISIFCERFNIDIHELIKISNHHPRVNILSPGCGVGGHCIAVDPWFIASKEPSLTPLIQTARNVNNRKSEWVVEKVSQSVDNLKTLQDRNVRVGCFGLAFKPNVDDLRESPALKIVQDLIQLGIEVLACDPYIDSYSGINLTNIEETLKGSDVFVFLVAHDQFKGLNICSENVFDFCGITKQF